MSSVRRRHRRLLCDLSECLDNRTRTEFGVVVLQHIPIHGVGWVKCCIIIFDSFLFEQIEQEWIMGVFVTVDQLINNLRTLWRISLDFTFTLELFSLPLFALDLLPFALPRRHRHLSLHRLSLPLRDINLRHRHHRHRKQQNS